MEDKKMVPLAEVKDILAERQGEGELTAEQKLALEHSQKFSRLRLEEVKETHQGADRARICVRGERGEDCGSSAISPRRCPAHLLEGESQRGEEPLGSVSPEATLPDFSLAGISSFDCEDEAAWHEEDAAVHQPSAMLISYLPFLPEDRHPQSETSPLVLLEDALNFADALDKAYQAYEPVRVPVSFFLFEPDDPALSRRPSLGALAAALDVCGQGSFSIEPWRFRP